MRRSTVFRIVTVFALGLVVISLHTAESTGFDSPAGIRRVKTTLEQASTIQTSILTRALVADPLFQVSCS